MPKDLLGKIRAPVSPVRGFLCQISRSPSRVPSWPEIGRQGTAEPLEDKCVAASDAFETPRTGGQPRFFIHRLTSAAPASSHAKAAK